MASEIVIPRLGWNMEQGVFVGWLKCDGDAVRRGEALFSLEGDKAVQEVEALDDGRLHIAASGPKPGETVNVGRVIGLVLAAGEVPPEPTEPLPAAAAASEAPPPRPPTPVAETRPAAPAISPRARRLATELKIDWTRLAGSGRRGRIREADVRAASAGGGSAAGRRRRAIAAHLAAGRADAVPVTLTVTQDASRLVDLRRQLQQAARDPVPGYTDCFIKLVARALEEHPLLQAVWNEGELEIPGETNVCMAIDTAAGLVAPVVRGPARLTLGQIAEQTRALTVRARAGTLMQSELEGGTFTITNLGGLGIEAFTPALHAPHPAILGLGRIAPQAVVVAGAVAVREMIPLSLTFDHRVLDGAPAARFLQTLGKMLSAPAAWLWE
jgi:pyruvate dehydrogenase E2 component (dihydrolipoamide acetyltransferase)